MAKKKEKKKIGKDENNNEHSRQIFLHIPENSRAGVVVAKIRVLMQEYSGNVLERGEKEKKEGGLGRKKEKIFKRGRICFFKKVIHLFI